MLLNWVGGGADVSPEVGTGFAMGLKAFIFEVCE
jgi:hypothetical protein